MYRDESVTDQLAVNGFVFVSGIRCFEYEQAMKLFRSQIHGHLSVLLLHREDGEKRLLWNLHAADLFHAFLSFLLLLQKFSLP